MSEQKNSSPLGEYSQPMILTFFGHLEGCIHRHVPNRIVPKPECPYIRPSGERCGKQVARQGCVSMEQGVPTGLCPEHYKRVCPRHGWDHQLSRCANTVCDRLGMSIQERMTITAKNITSILGLPAEVVCTTCCTDRVTTHHVSAKRKHAVSLPVPIPIPAIILSDSDEESIEESMEPRYQSFDVESDADEGSMSDDISEDLSEDIPSDGDYSNSSLYSTSSDDEDLCSQDEDVMNGE